MFRFKGNQTMWFWVVLVLGASASGCVTLLSVRDRHAVIQKKAKDTLYPWQHAKNIRCAKEINKLWAKTLAAYGILWISLLAYLVVSDPSWGDPKVPILCASLLVFLDLLACWVLFAHKTDLSHFTMPMLVDVPQALRDKELEVDQAIEELTCQGEAAREALVAARELKARIDYTIRDLWSRPRLQILEEAVLELTAKVEAMISVDAFDQKIIDELDQWLEHARYGSFQDKSLYERAWSAQRALVEMKRRLLAVKVEEHVSTVAELTQEVDAIVDGYREIGALSSRDSICLAEVPQIVAPG